MFREQPNFVLPPLSHKDKSVVYVGILAVTATAWYYLYWMAQQHAQMDMGGMDMMEMGMMSSMSGMVMENVFMLFVMWSVMMVAMMLPSLSPVAEIFTSLNLRKKKQAQLYVKTYVFVSGYLLVWFAFSLVLAVVQSQLSAAQLLGTAEMGSSNLLLSGSILLLAGVYQWTPLKIACLKYCRSPIGFLLNRWRDGKMGAVAMGWHYGLFCLGCCWALMVVMFAVGTMSLLWMVIIAIFVLCEKIFPPGAVVRNIAGVALVAWGGYLLLSYFTVL